MDSWLNILSDEERAAVMKTQITESETTLRTTIEQRESTKREKINAMDYHFIRGLTLVVCAIAASITVYHVIAVRSEVDLARIRAEHPASFAK